MLCDFDLVIFDCDGVLVDTERLTVGVEAAVLTELGWPTTPEEVVLRWMGRSSADQLREVADRLGPDAATTYDQRSSAVVREAYVRDLAPVDGVVAVLDALDAEDRATCVASSGTHARMDFTLGLTGLRERFAGRIFSATEVAHGKPAPDLFLHAARGMGVAPGRCAVVEDSVPGVAAGVAAGMTVFGYGGGLAAPHDLAGAGAHVVATMADLLR